MSFAANALKYNTFMVEQTMNPHAGNAPERWLPIAGYEGLYEVSDHGRVRGLDRLVPRGNRLVRVRGRILTQHKNVWSGKPGVIRVVQVCLTTRNVSRFKSVGPLALTAFVGPSPRGMECCHGDGNNQNNNLWNLRWDTHAENMLDVARYGGSTRPKRPARGERCATARLTEDDVRRIRAAPARRGVCHELAERFGVGYHAIWKVRSGDNWAHVR